MNLTNKKIFASAGVASGLVVMFGVIAPALISAPSTLAVVAGFAALIGLAIYGVILVRNALGMKPGNDNKQ